MSIHRRIRLESTENINFIQGENPRENRLTHYQGDEQMMLISRITDNKDDVVTKSSSSVNNKSRESGDPKQQSNKNHHQTPRQHQALFRELDRVQDDKKRWYSTFNYNEENNTDYNSQGPAISEEHKQDQNTLEAADKFNGGPDMDQINLIRGMYSFAGSQNMSPAQSPSLCSDE